MNFLHIILLAIFGLMPTGLAAPGKDDSEPKHDAPPNWCGYINKHVVQRYFLLGRGWASHEYTLFEAVKKTGATCLMTNWRYHEITDRETGQVDFNMTFETPIWCQKTVQKSINGYFGFKPAKKGGVHCPKVKETDALAELHKQLGPRRPYINDDPGDTKIELDDDDKHIKRPCKLNC